MPDLKLDDIRDKQIIIFALKRLIDELESPSEHFADSYSLMFIRHYDDSAFY